MNYVNNSTIVFKRVMDYSFSETELLETVFTSFPVSVPAHIRDSYMHDKSSEKCRFSVYTPLKLKIKKKKNINRKKGRKRKEERKGIERRKKERKGNEKEERKERETKERETKERERKKEGRKKEGRKV